MSKRWKARAMKKTVLLLMVFAGLTFGTYGQELILTANRDTLSWNGWDIQIRSLCFTTFSKDNDVDDNVVVFLYLLVKNNTQHGEAFIPQHDLKIIIGDKALDAADLDDGFQYMKNIAPAVARHRACYFEIPKALAKGSFIIRFSSLSAEDADVKVTISTKGDPLPSGITFPLAPPNVTGANNGPGYPPHAQRQA